MFGRGSILIDVAGAVGISVIVYLIRPSVPLAITIFIMVLLCDCLLYAWIWLVKKAEAVVAKRRGLTLEQYESRKPNVRFDLGGWPFQRQSQGQMQEINGWVFLVLVMSGIMLGKYLSIL